MLKHKLGLGYPKLSWHYLRTAPLHKPKCAKSLKYPPKKYNKGGGDWMLVLWGAGWHSQNHWKTKRLTDWISLEANWVKINFGQFCYYLYCCQYCHYYYNTNITIAPSFIAWIWLYQPLYHYIYIWGTHLTIISFPFKLWINILKLLFFL